MESEGKDVDRRVYLADMVYQPGGSPGMSMKRPITLYVVTDMCADHACVYRYTWPCMSASSGI